MALVESQRSPEIDFDPKSVAVVSTSYYPKYGKEDGLIDNARANMMLQMAQEVQKRGYQMVVVDGGSPTEFRTQLEGLGVTVLSETESGMAASRRQVINAGSLIEGVKIIAWSEEKPSLFLDNDPSVLFGPILRNEADMIIPDRGDNGRATYLPGQREWEERGNRTLNAILEHQGFKQPGTPVIDAWIGPRIFRNNPAIIEIFNRIYEYEKVTTVGRRATDIHKRINPERWSNSIFLPIINLMNEGFRVISIPVNYVHSAEMNASEQDNSVMEDKRKTQFVDIIHTSTHLAIKLNGRVRSRISRVK